MIDINASGFIQDFDVKKGTVGLIGHGCTGQAIESFFHGSCKTLVHDKDDSSSASLSDVVAEAELIFVTVPLPVKSDGSCHSGVIENVLDRIKEATEKLNRNLDSFIVILESLVKPGFTEEMQNKHFGMRILFSPEFFTESNVFSGFKTQNRIILGGDEQDSLVVFKYFEGVMPERVAKGNCLLLNCDPTVAETVKLYASGILMAKKMFSNEMYLACQKLGIEYEEVRALACLDRYVGSGCTFSPGPDGKFACEDCFLTKDINNLRAFLKEISVQEKVISAVAECNLDFCRSKNHD
jgi:UDP-glucose 6-dehydrogenase